MDNTEYLKEHHNITESHIGLIRVRLDQGDLEAAKYFADRCAEELHKLWEQEMQYGGFNWRD